MSGPVNQPTMTHECFVTGCYRRIPRDKLMCGRHWAMVPPQYQKAVWRAWRQGTMREYTEAVGAAREEVLKKIVARKGR